MIRNAFLAGLALVWLACAAAPAQGDKTSSASKTLRYAFLVAESGFDPVQITDLYSNIINNGMFEAPMEYEFLAHPARIRPNTAVAMPEVSADFKTFTYRIQPGIYFTDDPAFKGQRRELVAQDYVFTIKRHYDPRWKSGRLYLLEGARLVGLSEQRKQHLADKTPFDYDRDVAGLKAIDRYTFQVRLAEPAPRFNGLMALAGVTGAMAREVVEFYGDKISEHPVGTGPYKLAQWTRSSRIVMARNTAYREVLYDEHPPEGDARLQAVATKFKGRKLPMIDRVEVAIIEESQPRWLSFLNAEQDLMDQLPFDFAEKVIPNNQLAPHLAKRGMGMVRYPRSDVSVSYFGMEHPVVGGYEPHKVALRRAIAMAVDGEREIRMVRRSQAIPGQSIVGPLTYGYDAAFKSEMSEFNLPRAKALLDLHGYVDKDGDGWREQPNGQALLLEYATQPDGQSRQLIEQWKRNMDALGIRIEFKPAKWPENLKSSRAGKLMMWGVGWTAGSPDAQEFLALGYGPDKGQANHARFDLPAFNKAYEAQRVLPDGLERLALINEAKKLMIAYMPYKVHAHRMFTDLTHPWVLGYHRNVFVTNFWKYVDIDSAELARRSSQ